MNTRIKAHRAASLVLVLIAGALGVFELLAGCKSRASSPPAKQPSASATVPTAQFHWDSATQTLQVSTPTLKLAIQGGAVIALTDVRSSTVFASTADWQLIQKSDTGFVTTQEMSRLGRTAPVRRRVRHRPSQKSQVAFTRTSAREVQLTYTHLRNAPPTDSLTIRIRAETHGELGFRVAARVASGQAPDEVDLPFVGLTPAAVIAGIGERFARGDPPGQARCVHVAHHLYGPPVAVIQGQQGVIGMWPEGDVYSYDDMYVEHAIASDEVVPQVNLAVNPKADAKDPATLAEPGVSSTSWWRLAALPSWLDVAKRYRAHFARVSGAKPLWAQQPRWVEKIHAVTTARPNTTDPTIADTYYAQLAGKFDPEKLLLFYWNGSSIVSYGNNRYLTRFQRPTPEEIAALRRHGFHWMGYHPYDLIHSPSGMRRRLAQERARGLGVPKDYVFKPDYAGRPTVADFYSYWRDIAGGYNRPLDDDADKFWVLHPGATRTRQYLARSLGDYCRAHDMSGAYLDTLGNDDSWKFLAYAPSDRRIIQRLDDRRGTVLALQAMRSANPGLGLMSEYGSPWTVPSVFYTWDAELEGTRPDASLRLNHPLRTACWGSYAWTNTSTPRALALMGGLPELRAGDDWFLARAKLYMDQDLFNALPEHWDPAALAYYRGKAGAWFEYRKMPWGTAYVKVLGPRLKVLLGRLAGQRESPLAEPVRIQNWVGYHNNKAIGLNPAHTYDFVVEPPPSDDPLTITHVPDDVYISATHHAPGYSVVEFGRSRGRDPAKIEISFQRPCLGVVDATRRIGGPFPARSSLNVTITVPGALVFLWKQPTVAAPSRFFRKPTTIGHASANGVPYSYWTYNSAIRWEPYSVDAALKFKTATTGTPALTLGMGEYRGYADQWVRLPAGKSSRLMFQVTLPPAPGPKYSVGKVAVSVCVNGSTIWRKELVGGRVWSGEEVSLLPYAGRRVLITLSAEGVSGSDWQPGAGMRTQAVRFRGLRIVDARRSRP